MGRVDYKQSKAPGNIVFPGAFIMAIARITDFGAPLFVPKAMVSRDSSRSGLPPFPYAGYRERATVSAPAGPPFSRAPVWATGQAPVPVRSDLRGRKDSRP